ncbi:MAG TPA: hypothetical protein VGK32_04415 [Vicinamibacterales bacterium]|jgi:hypothetical protein
MPILYIVVWMLLIVIVGGALVRRQRRRADAGVRQLAAALGFELLEGMEAVDRTIPTTLRQAAREAREKIPAGLRKWAELPAKGALCIAGTADGVEVTIYPDSRGSGKTNTKYTVVRADYPKPLPFDLRIGSEGVFTRMGKALFGFRDVEIGDEEFDRAARVKAADEAGAKVVLGKPGARDAVLGLLATSAYATGAYAQWEEQGRHFDPGKTRERMAAVVAVARTLGGD